MINEGFGDNIKKLWNSIKTLVSRGESGDESVVDDAEELKTQIENDAIKIPSIFKRTILGILMSLIAANAAGFTNPDVAYQKMDKQIAAAEAKYGKNFGSITTVKTYKATAAQRMATILDKKHDYNVKIKHIASAKDSKSFKFDDGATLVWLKGGNVVIYDEDGDSIGEFFGSAADMLITNAKQIINQNKAVSEAKRILTRAGYTLLKD